MNKRIIVLLLLIFSFTNSLTDKELYARKASAAVTGDQDVEILYDKWELHLGTNNTYYGRRRTVKRINTIPGKTRFKLFIARSLASSPVKGFYHR